MEIKKGNQGALILLHEIYGINRFMEETANHYCEKGFDVYCPNMLKRPCFPYDQEQTAYAYFRENVGFDCNHNIEMLTLKLKAEYHRVFLLGFSAGATIAWRVAAKGTPDAAVCCYGSRIRDYLTLTPQCRTLLILAEEESFSVKSVMATIDKKVRTESLLFAAHHGFLDPYCKFYNKTQAFKAKYYIEEFFLK